MQTLHRYLIRRLFAIIFVPLRMCRCADFGCADGLRFLNPHIRTFKIRTSSMALKKAQEREYARVLFIAENLSQKVIAERVGVTEKTLGNWIEKGDWKKLKRSMLTTRQNQLVLLYDQLDWLNLEISVRDFKSATIKEADIIIKLTAAIKNLEIEISLGETIEVARGFIGFLGQHDNELSKKVTTFFDLYIQTKAR